MENNNQLSDIKTEQAILGLAIAHNDLVNLLLEKINETDFYDMRNTIVFQAIKELNFQNIPIDLNIVRNKIETQGQMDSIGGEAYLISLIYDSYYKANYESYLDNIKERSKKRKLVMIGEELTSAAISSDKTADELVANTSQKIYEISNYNHDSGLVRIGDIIQETFTYIAQMAENDSDITGVTTGFHDLNKQLSGLQNSDFILLAARPSVGKTALGIHMALNAAEKAQKKVAVFSLEMSKRQILQRILSILSKVELQDIISGNIKEEDWALLLNTTKTINELDMYIDDTASISITELRAKSKRMKVDKGLDLIVIDYLQLMTSDGRNENRQQEISNISRGLKALAKELNIPVLALSQLSRKSEERSNKRPMLSDLRESGAIEQDADVVMMLYRDDYYEEDSEEQNIIEINVAKHRNGPTGTTKLYFKKENTAFYDLGYINESN